MVGVHTWSEEHCGPVAYVLANTLVLSGSGEHQASTDHYVLSTYGVKNVCAVVGDNASTQSGARKGHAVLLGQKFDTPIVFIGCYPHILNIALRNAMVGGFGHRGSMHSFNLYQLHYKVGYIHHGKPTYYQALYVSQGILPRAPPLPQEFVETRWTYIHSALKWWQKYGDACIRLGKCVLERLPKKESHYSIWEEIIQMAANPVLQVERVALLELLDRLIMPGLEACQKGDYELNFSSGYLARSWPMHVLKDQHIAELMRQFPDFAMPLTTVAMNEKLDPARKQHFKCNVVAPMMTAVCNSFEKHANRWLKFPLLFAMGADSKFRHFFWRAYLRVTGKPVAVASFTHANPPQLPDKQLSLLPLLYKRLTEAALSLKNPGDLAWHCYREKILDQKSYLLGESCTAWYEEFHILSLVASQAAELQLWAERWSLTTPDILAEVTAVAHQADSTAPSPDEPHLWRWFCNYIFAMPVNNVVAERQFNIADIYIHPNESELSKQATHLFVENVLHSTSSRLQLYESMSGSTRKKVRITKAVMRHVGQQMRQYAATVTPARLRAARKQVQHIQTGRSAARPPTTRDVYSRALDHHRKRPDHEAQMVALEEKGRQHELPHVERSFPSSAPSAQSRSLQTPAEKTDSNVSQQYEQSAAVESTNT